MSMSKPNPFKLKQIPKKEEIRLDFGCGRSKAPGFLGVDIIKFDGVDFVIDLKDTTKKWQWDDNSVTEARASHFVEHLTSDERVHFVNELHRILIVGGKCQVITPHWSSNRAYGDPTHKWPPVSEMWFYYLNKEWRKKETPHCDIEFNPNGFDCDFEATWGYTLRADIPVRNAEYQQFAIQNYKEVCLDIVAMLAKK